MSASRDARRALARLLLVRARAALRGLVRKGRRGTRAFAIGVLALGILGMQAGRSDARVVEGFAGLSLLDTSSLYLTPFLVLGVIGGAWSRGLGFSPSEVQFLFPAPVGDGTLVAWRMASHLLRLLPTALVLALLVPAGTSYLQRASTWLLAMGLIATLTVAIGARIATLRPARRALARWGLLTVVLGALAAAALVGAHADGLRGALHALAAPGRPFARCLLAPTAGEAARAALPLAVVLAGAVLWGATIRGGLREPAAEVSRRIDRAVSRMRQGGLYGGAPSRSRTLPRLPSWGGVGPHVWRQLTSLLRRRRSYLALVLVATFVTLPQLVVGDEPHWGAAVAAILGMLLFVGPIYVQCDFRSDFDQLAWMRSWPCRPHVLAAGQLLATALVLTVLQVALTLWYPLFVGLGDRWPLALGLLAILPLANLINVAVWNGGFLLLPARPPVSGAQAPSVGDVGRWQLLLFGSLMATIVLLGIALGFGALVHAIARAALDLPPPAALALAVAGGWLALALQAGSAVWLVGRLFRRVDPARDLLG